MKRLFLMVVALAVPFHGVNATDTKPSLGELACTAISGDPSESTAAMAALREAGPAGLQALLETHAAMIERRHANPSLDDDQWQRVSAALDAVARQRDAWASGLYWFTDFERAKAEARATGKPILSLRLLGNLDEEFSCANSRFFRTVLYPNAEVARVLREEFVLYWKSVRPVPRVTIDFGDGRVLQRTITGNSIHYVLDTDGHIIDALPALYGPKAFLAGLRSATQAAAASAKLDASQRGKFLRDYHDQRIAEMERSCHDDADKAGIAGVNPTQWDEAAWKRVAMLHREDVKLDGSSIELMHANLPDAMTATRLAVSKVVVETPLMREVRTLERSIAEDTVRNEYTLHRTIHEWLARGTAGDNADAFNQRVYAELFLSPLSDPWLGLAPQDVYSALAGGGEKLANKLTSGRTR
jgi:hypothetical protein